MKQSTMTGELQGERKEESLDSRVGMKPLDYLEAEITNLTYQLCSLIIKMILHSDIGICVKLAMNQIKV